MPPANTGNRETKAYWRKLMRDRRGEAREAERQEVVGAIASALPALPEWHAASVVASYMAFGSELTLDPIDALAREAGKVVVYPRVVGPGVMAFHTWRPGDSVALSDKGLREPLATAQSTPADEIEFFLIPLLACDSDGIRLGYGGGFYDRVLAESPGFRCGVGFSWQRVDQLPGEAHDQRLQGFVSETGFERYY